MTFRHRFQRLLGLPALLGALLLSGCEATVFHFANRGLPPPDASAVYAPERELSLDIYRPRGAQAPFPVVVVFYGGAWKRGSRDQYRFVGQRLAQNGVLAIVADYRTWLRAGFPAFMDDAADAVAWAHSHAGEYGGDPQRLFLAGHSAGAQIPGLLGTDTRYLSARGLRPAQLAGVIGLSGPYDFNVGSVYAEIFGPPSQWPRAQTVNFVDGDEPPFLLVHGQDDRTVEVRDSIELATTCSPAALLAANKRLFGRPWNYRTERGARAFFERWQDAFEWRRLQPYRKYVRMIERHWDGIASCCDPNNQGQPPRGLRAEQQNVCPATQGLRLPRRGLSEARDHRFLLAAAAKQADNDPH